MLLIFNTRVVDSLGWEIVRDDYLVLKRYDLSLEDIRLLDYKIPYPPSEIMQGMKMFPPYSEK